MKIKMYLFVLSSKRLYKILYDALVFGYFDKYIIQLVALIVV